MLSKGRVIALDHGTKKVGVAISDPDRFVVFPRETLINDDQLISKILDLIVENSVVEVVLGWPLNFDGTESRQTEIVRGFACELEKNLSIPLILRDERLTTFDAHEKIAEADQRQITADKDQLAAMVILEEYLGLS